MTDGQTAGVIASVLCLVLVLSSLIGRRINWGFALKSVLAWAAIIGVVVVVALNRGAIVRAFNDLEYQAGLGDQQTVGSTIRIAQGDDGHFHARVTVNGVTRTMLIDSGATTTALSEASAKAFGLTVDRTREPVEINTANGVVQAWSVVVPQLSIGLIDTTDIEVVVSPKFGDTDVVGMNFLSRLKSWRVERGMLILEPATGNVPARNTEDRLT